MGRSWLRGAFVALVAVCALGVSPEARGEPGWKMAAPLPKAIGEIEAATVNGKIYVLSGLDNRPGVVSPTGYNWCYDPATNAWTDRKPMPVPAHHIMVATWNDKIYVFGGFVRPPSVLAWQPIDRAWEYDPATDSWKELAPMPTPRGAGQAVEVGSKIYVIGGVRSNRPGDAGAPIPLGSTDQLVLGTVEEYDPATNQWRARSPMPTARNHFFAGAVGGKIYAVDGRIGTVFVTKSDTIDLVDSYDPTTDHWAFASRAPTTRGDVTGGEHDGLLRRRRRVSGLPAQDDVLGGRGVQSKDRRLVCSAAYAGRTPRLCGGLHRREAACHGWRLSIGRHAGRRSDHGNPRGDRSRREMNRVRAGELRSLQALRSNLPVRTDGDCWPGQTGAPLRVSQ